MKFQGERTFTQAPNQLFALLGDAAFLVSCIPDATTVGTPSPETAQCSVRPQFSFVRGHLDVAIQVLSRDTPTTARFLLASKGIGSSADVEASLTFAPIDTGTKIVWNAEVVKLGGLLKAVPAGLIRGAAQKVIDGVWDGIATKLA